MRKKIPRLIWSSNGEVGIADHGGTVRIEAARHDDVTNGSGYEGFVLYFAFVVVVLAS
jgi:hypothetical protein